MSCFASAAKIPELEKRKMKYEKGENGEIQLA